MESDLQDIKATCTRIVGALEGQFGGAGLVTRLAEVEKTAEEALAAVRGLAKLDDEFKGFAKRHWALQKVVWCAAGGVVAIVWIVEHYFLK